MKKLLILSTMLLGACVYTPVINQTDLQKVDFDKLYEQKRGKSCQRVLFGLFPINPEASVAYAAWDANIKKVSYVEKSSSYFIPILPILIENCVIVYGE
jgi:hypothetical protein